MAPLEYEKLEDLERYALASGDERAALMAGAAAGAVTPGQVFMAGLHACQAQDLPGVKAALRSLESMTVRQYDTSLRQYKEELEARAAMMEWSLGGPGGKAATAAYLSNVLGLSFDDVPPAGALATPQIPQQQPLQQGQKPPEQQLLPVGQQALQPAVAPTAPPPPSPSSLSPDDHSLQAFLSLALQRQGPSGPQRVFSMAAWARLFSGGVPQVSSEVLEGVLAQAPAVSVLGQAGMGLLQRAIEEGKYHLLEALALTLQQMRSLIAAVPELAWQPQLQAWCVRKLYPSEWRRWADAESAPLEARAELLDKVRTFAEELRAEAGLPQERLAWLELRLAAAEVRLQLQQGSLSVDAVTALLRATAAASPPPLPGSSSTAPRHPQGLLHPDFAAATAAASSGTSGIGIIGISGNGGGAWACEAWDLGPALPPCSREPRELIVQAVSELIRTSEDPEVLFAKGGWGSGLAGMLDMRLEAQLLAEGLLTRCRTGSTTGGGIAIGSSGGGTSGTGGAIGSGSGGASVEKWAGMLDAVAGPGAAAALQERVELKLCPDNPARFEGVIPADGPAPVLTVSSKAVSHLTIKVFEMNPWNFYTAQAAGPDSNSNRPLKELDASICLDGLGATHEAVVDLSAHGPFERARTAVELPWLKGRRGVWVVEVIGGGRHARAVLRVGAVRVVSRCSAAGHALTLLYEDNTPLPADAARVHLDGREYAPAFASGTSGSGSGSGVPEVLIPYRPDALGHAPGAALVLGDGSGFASLARLDHLTETYNFSCGMHLDPECAAARAQAPLALQPALTLHGWRVPLALLQDVSLQITTTDADGHSSSTTASDLNLGDGLKAVVQPVTIPDRCVRVSAVLTGRIQKSQPGPDGEMVYQEVQAAHSWELNSSDLSRRTHHPHLTLNPASTPGGPATYSLAVLGRAGEPAAEGTLVEVRLRHALVRAAEEELQVTTTLATDASGCVHLGPLADISHVTASLPPPPGGTPLDPPPRVTWRLAAPAAPAALPPHVMCFVHSPDLKISVPHPWVRSASALGTATAAQDSSSAAAVDLQREGIALLDLSGLESGGVARDLTASHVEAADLSRGLLTVSGLPPGTYHLVALALSGVPVTIRVFPGAPVCTALATGPASMILGSGDVGAAVAAEARPLQVTHVDADVSRGVRLQLHGSPKELASAAVHVLLTRFVPLKAHGQGLLEVARPLSYSSLPGWTPLPRNEYQSDRMMSEEVRYVMERRRLEAEGKVRPGVLLDRPSLLVHPQQQPGATRTDTQHARAGEAFRSPRHAAFDGAGMANACMACPPAMKMFAAAPLASAYRRAPEVLASLGTPFCPPGLLLTNVKVNRSTGTVELTASQLAAAAGVPDLATLGFRCVTVMAYSTRSGGTSQACVPLNGAASLVTAPRNTAMLQRPFAAGSPCIEARSSVVLLPGRQLTVADVSSARLQLYGSLPAAWRLFGALLGADARDGQSASHWGAFSFVPAWCGLSGRMKRARYGGHACRELDFFLLHKDREMFMELCLPAIKSKLASERGFLDDWMLAAADALQQQHPDGSTWGPLVHRWSQPHRYAKLNALEQVLLAAASWGAAAGAGDAAGAAAAAAALGRWAEETRAQVRALGPPERERQRRRMLVALTAGQDAAAKAGAAAPPSPPPPPAGAAPGSFGAPAAPPPMMAMGRAPPPLPPPPGVAFGAAGGAPPPPMTFGAAAPPPSAPAGAPRRVIREEESGWISVPEGEGVDASEEGGGASEEEGAAEDHSEQADEEEEEEEGAAEAEEEEEDKQAEGGDGGHFAADLALRTRQAGAPPVYRPQQSTRVWCEGGYYKAGPDTPPEQLAPRSLFWADYASHLASHITRMGQAGSMDALVARGVTGSLLTKRLELAAATFTDALLALAVTGLPWQEVPPASVAAAAPAAAAAAAPPSGGTSISTTGGSAASESAGTAAPGGGSGSSAGAAGAAAGGSAGMVLTAAPGAPLVAYLQQTRPAAAAAAAAEEEDAAAQAKVVVMQRVVDPSDAAPRARHVSSSRAKRAKKAVPQRDYCDPESDDACDDDWTDEEEEAGGPREVRGPLLAGRVYVCQVTVTSRCPRPLSLDLTLPAPRGCVVLGGKPSVWTTQVHLGPYGTQRVELPFYFPATGSGASAGGNSAGVEAAGGSRAVMVDQFPAAVAYKRKLVGWARDLPLALAVVMHTHAPEQAQPGADEGGQLLSWRDLCNTPLAPASNQAIIDFITAAPDLGSEDLALLRWRLKADPAFFVDVTDALRARRMWPEAVWSYALHHRHEPTLRELLATRRCCGALLPKLRAHAGLPPLLPADGPQPPEPKQASRHAEFWPLVNPRAHPLGGERQVLNREARAQWRALLQAAARRPGGPGGMECLQAAALLVMQDRLDEADALLDRAQKLGREQQGEQLPAMQLDYLRLWLLLAAPTAAATPLAALREAAATADGYAASACGSDPRWGGRWRQVAAHLQDALAVAAGAPAPLPTDAAAGAGEGGDGAAQAATTPASLQLLEDPADRSALLADVAGIDKLTVSVFEMDAEVLFSSQPFAAAADGAQDGAATPPGQQQRQQEGAAAGGNFAFVRATHSATVAVADLPPAAAGSATRAAGDAAGAAGAAAAAGAAGSGRVRVELSRLFPSLQPTAAVMVEVCGGGLTRRRALFRCSLATRPFESLGLLQVTDAAGAPVVAAYVKAFSLPAGADGPVPAPWPGGAPGSASSSPRFHKDGYTDRLGRFDYWSLTSDNRCKISRLALLVSHPQHGAMWLQVTPPPH